MMNLASDVWLALVAREQSECQCCGATEDLAPAHYVSRARGGSDDLDNLMLLCFWCHRKLHDYEMLVKKIDNHFYFRYGGRSP